ncbi:hypothetical protein [Endozoicomonas sp.]|uniref:hypothetical protein n=1 Tax=Endozoicomonas sp. TaxID=1892382 RepID=UPI00383A3F4C
MDVLFCSSNQHQKPDEERTGRPQKEQKEQDTRKVIHAIFMDKIMEVLFCDVLFCHCQEIERTGHPQIYPYYFHG